MSASHSITVWIDRLKAGDSAAAQRLWEDYFDKLTRLARRQLRDTPRRAADEEDVALSAFDSFCRGAGQGRFPQLGDRHDLWQLLLVITSRKAIDLHHYERRQKRGGGAVLGESALGRPEDSAQRPGGLAQIEGTEPTPAFAAQVAEECERLLAMLNDADLRTIALWKLEGYGNEEIATKLGCVPRTVERKLRRIRTIWEHPEEAR
jgi:DNA-directed RNA polymerase specialized sigma24 family protein